MIFFVLHIHTRSEHIPLFCFRHPRIEGNGSGCMEQALEGVGLSWSLLVITGRVKLPGKRFIASLCLCNAVIRKNSPVVFSREKPLELELAV